MVGLGQLPFLLRRAAALTVSQNVTLPTRFLPTPGTSARGWPSIASCQGSDPCLPGPPCGFLAGAIKIGALSKAMLSSEQYTASVF